VGEVSPSALAGQRIVITRAALESEALKTQLAALGAIPVVLPLVAFADPDDFTALDTAIARIARFDWVMFTSGQAVRAIVARSKNLQLPLARAGNKPLFAAVGPASADAARQAGLPVEYVAITHNGLALAEELRERLRGRNVLLPRSDRANPDLPVALARHGAAVTEAVAYRTLQPTDVDAHSLSRIVAGEAAAILFFSPSAVQHFAELVGVDQLHRLEDRLAIIAVGPVTARALRNAGAERILVAADTTPGAVVRTLEEYFSARTRHSTAGVKRG
jgi:uroporphyrinogen-III synthase